jgi:hypothetical protein
MTKGDGLEAVRWACGTRAVMIWFGKMDPILQGANGDLMFNFDESIRFFKERRRS